MIDGVAGAIRNQELKGQTKDVLKQIIAQYESLEEETQASVSNIYKTLKDELNSRLNRYFQNRIQDARDRLRKAKEVAVLGSKKKEEICSTVKYVRNLMQWTN